MKTVKVGGGNHTENENPPEAAFDEGPNPLLNSVVLAELMSYLPVPDLRQCRLVNSAWRTAATPYLKKNSWLKSFKTFSIIRLPGVLPIPGTSKYLDDLCFSKHNLRRQERTELGLFGIQNFNVHLSPFLRNPSAERILLKFLEDYGTNVLNLVVLEISIATLELLGTVLTCLPNLVSLTINLIEDFGEEAGLHVWPSSTLPRGMPSIKRISIVNGSHIEVKGGIVASNHYNFLKRLFQIAPNLETLKLKNSLRVWGPNWNNDYTQSMNLYLRLLKDEGKALCPKLKDLNLADFISKLDMNLILQLDINFRELVLPKLIQAYGVYPTGTVMDGVTKKVGPFLLNLLERHQSSLEVLELGMPSPIKKDATSSPFSLQFPCLPKLRKLLISLSIYNSDESAVIKFDPVDYATQFPALRELGLFYDGFNESGRNPSRFDCRIDFYNQFFPENGQVCPALQRLSLEVPDPKRRMKKDMNPAYHQFSSRLELMFPNVHNHEEVKACRAKQPSDLDQIIGGNETRRVTRSMTKGSK